MAGIDEKVLTAIVLGVFVVVLFAVIGRSWMRRTRREENEGHLPELPADLAEREPGAAVEGMYVATCVRGNHLARLVGHGLGVRTTARVFAYDDGVLYDRDGTQPLWVPRDEIDGFGTASGMVGKFVEKNGLVVLSWRLHEREVDTGVRTKTREGKAELLEAFSRLTAREEAPGSPGPQPEPDDDAAPSPDPTQSSFGAEPTGTQKETP
ncbi:ABC transporter permease [Kocuria coralli]|uniref:ABC transporter permease n=1 Tax=Kocuria coralli TaxID=1461025 RepID=A0A5J5L1W9_9MICC|nr:ABC transporter permease [Kocuria coralli]KAA9395086.1 ABC transporter permease [Kocuria coralli]